MYCDSGYCFRLPQSKEFAHRQLLIAFKTLRSVLLRLEHGVHNLHGQISNLRALYQQTDSAHNQLSIQQQDDTQQSMNRIMVAQNRLQLKVDLLEAMHIARVAEAAASNTSEASRNIQNPPQEIDLSQPVGLTASRTGLSCAVECRCACHTRTTIRLRALSRFLGSLFVGYIGLPFIMAKCDDHHCRQRAYSVILTTYVFPAWLLARAFTIAFRLLPHAGPELIIRVNPIVPSSWASFTLASEGDVDGLKRALSNGLGSPFDTDSTNGYSPLLVGSRNLSDATASAYTDNSTLSILSKQ